MKKQASTGIPGLKKIENGYALRVVVRRSSVTTEKTKILRGVSRGAAVVALEHLRVLAQQEAESQALGEPTTQTLTAYARRFCEELGRRLAKGKISRHTARNYQDHLTRFVLPFFETKAVHDVKARDVVAWLRWLETQTTKTERHTRGGTRYRQPARPYSKGFLRSVWRTARVFFRAVVVEADLAKNPFDHVRFDLDAPGPKPKPVLTRDEVAALLEAAREESLQIQAMFVVGFCGATRFSELSALTWHDVDLEAGTIRIERSQVAGVVGPPKTEGSRRLIALPPEAVALLKRHRAEQRTGDDRPRHEMLFPSREGTYLTPKSLTPPLQRCAQRAGIGKALSSHCLRRTANNLIRQAAGDLVAQAVTGHVTLAMTLHYSDVDTKERLQALRGAFGGALEAVLEAVPEENGAPPLPEEWEYSHSADEESAGENAKTQRRTLGFR